MVDVRELLDQLGVVQPGRFVAEEELGLAVADVASTVSQPSPRLAEDACGAQRLGQLLQREVAARFLHDGQHLGRLTQHIGHVQMSGAAAAQHHHLQFFVELSHGIPLALALVAPRYRPCPSSGHQRRTWQPSWDTRSANRRPI